MAVNSSRSMNKSLDEGATDGKYRKVRPDTEVIAGLGDEQTVSKVMGDIITMINKSYPDKQIPMTGQ